MYVPTVHSPAESLQQVLVDGQIDKAAKCRIELRNHAIERATKVKERNLRTGSRRKLLRILKVKLTIVIGQSAGLIQQNVGFGRGGMTDLKIGEYLRIEIGRRRSDLGHNGAGGPDSRASREAIG